MLELRSFKKLICFVGNNGQSKTIWGMSQTEGEWWWVQRGESSKESLKERENFYS
jgi:hypothetical protein